MLRLIVAAFAAAPLAAQVDHAAMGHGGVAVVAPLGISMDRQGSGTSWIPDAVPLPGVHVTGEGWMLMAHGAGFFQYVKQQGPRGGEQLALLNWFMLMATGNVAGGRLQARGMASLEGMTVPEGGYPLLLQAAMPREGSAGAGGGGHGGHLMALDTHLVQGTTLIDQQHQHKLLMELAVMYESALGPSLGMLLYVAPVGEPALGPVAFMHRPSGAEDPTAPIGHHWQDATHVVDGVVTAGVFGRRWKLEASAFNGGALSHDPLDFPDPRLGSWSGRLTINADSSLSFSAGYGILEDHEGPPPVSVRRATASVLHSSRVGERSSWTSALVWGLNRRESRSTHSALVETAVSLAPRNTIWLRAELVQKTARDLALRSSVAGDPLPTDAFNVAALSLGYARELATLRKATLGLGVRGTLNVVPDALVPYYETTRPLGLTVFLRVRPK